MASAGIHGLEVTKQAQGVITINGTTGYEAAMLGIPVIVLATHCDYSFLDHVFHCPKGEGLDRWRYPPHESDVLPGRIHELMGLDRLKDKVGALF